MATALMPTYDYETESDALKRRQAIADAMQMSSLKPMELPQQPGVKASWTQALAKLMEGYVAGKSAEAVKTDRTTLADRYAKDTSDAFSQFEATSQLPDGGRKAVLDALASRNPAIRQYAMQVAAKQQEGRLTPKDLSAHATSDSVLKDPTNPASWTPKRKLDQATPGNVLYDEGGAVANLTQPAGTAPVGQPGLPSGPGWGTRKLEGDLYQEAGTGLKKLDNAPKTNVTVAPVIAGQKAGLEKYWSKAAEHVDALGQVAGQASALKQSVAELRQLDANGIFSNATSGPATLLTNIGQLVGVKVDAAKLANTETYNAVTTDLWQGLVSKFGGNRGVTKEEAVEIKKMLPLAASSPQARQQLFTILDNISTRQITQYTNANKSFAKAVKMDDPEVFAAEIGDVYKPMPTEPVAATKPGGAKPSVSNW